MDNKKSFQIYYDGPALTNNEMDVRDLAPALIAVSDLLDEANKIISQGKTKIQVNVKGSFKSGSFHIDFVIVQQAIQQVAELFGVSRDTSAQMILAIILGTAGTGAYIGKKSVLGLFQFVKWLGKKKIKTIEKDSETSTLRITVEEETVEIYPEVLDLFKSVKVRKSLEMIVKKPLESNGVDTFAYLGEESDKPIEIIDKNSSEFFVAPEIADEKLEDEIYETDVQLTQISFKEGIKWKFTDGSVEFLAIVSDPDFVKKVQESKASFSKDDILRVKVKKHKWISDTGIKSDYEVEKIISHRPSAKQIPLLIDDQ